MIKKILVPIDFSPVSAEALQYAIAFARKTDVQQIDVLHVFTPEMSADPIMTPTFDMLLTQHEASMTAFVKKSNPPESITVQEEVKIGFAADEITTASSEYDLLIMGTTGETGVFERIFGKVASAVAQHAHCAVLLVPAGLTFRKYTQIMYAGNDFSLSRRAMEKFAEFNDLFHARTHFVHVDDDETQVKSREELFGALFDSSDLSFAFDVGQVRAETVVDGLKTYAEKHRIDLAVMVTQHRGFWADFFHSSQTRQMILSPELPLLVLHVEE